MTFVYEYAIYEKLDTNVKALPKTFTAVKAKDAEAALKQVEVRFPRDKYTAKLLGTHRKF